MGSYSGTGNRKGRPHARLSYTTAPLFDSTKLIGAMRELFESKCNCATPVNAQTPPTLPTSSFTPKLSNPSGRHTLTAAKKEGGEETQNLMEVLMQSRFTPLFLFIACFSLIGVAGGGEGGGDAKPVKKIVRAPDGLNIVCEVCGKGDIALVFLHGWCGDRAYWKHQVDAFAADCRIVAVDQAGHGESGKDRKVWSVSGLAEDVEAVVKDLGLQRVILVGHSMGGPVALLAARRMPGTVVAVVGVDTLQNAEFKMPEESATKFLKAFETDFKGTMHGGLSGLLNERADPDLKQWLVTRAEAQDQRMALGLMRDMSALDTKAILKDVKVPVRCINSGGGYAFFTPTAVAVNKKYADYDALLIQNVGHYPMLEKPTEFNAKLREVLKDIADKK